MKSVLISIIVPVYKTEKYLAKCIESILKQTYENYELILVDDGSPDNSGRICDSYAARDKRIQCIHTKNYGASSARNTGIKFAKGDFIVFIDSDDWVTEDHLENLLSVAAYNGLGACKLFIKAPKRREQGFRTLKKVEAAISIYSSSGMGGFPFNKIFDRNVIKKHNIQFDLRYTMCEDLLFCIQYIRYMNDFYVKYSQRKTYCYVLRPGAVKGRFQKGHVFSSKDFSEYLAVKESQKYLLDADVQSASNVRLVKGAVNTLRAVVAGNHTDCIEYKELLAFIRKNLFPVLFSNNIALSSKLSTFISAISPQLEYYVYMKQEKNGGI